MPNKPDNPFKFWEELKRRKVVRVVTVYAAAAFVILEVVSIIVEPLHLPEWTLPLIIVLLGIGFIISIVMSWVYDITPEGVQKTKPIIEVQKAEKTVTSNSWKIATYVSVVIIVGLLIVNILGGKKHVAVDTELEKSIAVLPFKDFSADSNQEYMCDGLTDEVINHLYKIESFEKVVSLNSVLTYRETLKRVPEIANELDVNYILEGTYKKIGDQVRVTAQLIEPKNDKHIWQNEYDQPFKEIIDIQIDIAKQIAAELKTVLTPEEIEQIDKPATENSEAYDLYLKGRYFWNRRTEEGIKEAIEYFKNAIEIDTNYSLAYAGLADCYSMMGVYRYASSPDDIQNSFRDARDAAIKAIEIDSTLAEAYTSLGVVKLYNDWNWTGAKKDFERSIQLNFNYAPAHQQYASCLMVLKQFNNALAEVKLARDLDPASPIISSDVGQILYRTKKYDQAIEESLKVLTFSPDHFPAYSIIGKSYLRKGMKSEAIINMQKAVRYSGDTLRFKAGLGYVYGATGNHDKAREILNDLFILSNERYVSSISIANIYIGLGENKNAIIWLEKAYEEHSPACIGFYHNVIFDPLRSDPKFIELVKKMGFEE